MGLQEATPFFFKILFYDRHFINQVTAVAQLVDDEENVTDIEGDVAADLRVEDYVAHGAFPYAVEVEADQVAVSIDDRAS